MNFIKALGLGKLDGELQHIRIYTNYVILTVDCFVCLFCLI